MTLLHCVSQLSLQLSARGASVSRARLRRTLRHGAHHNVRIDTARHHVVHGARYEEGLVRDKRSKTPDGEKGDCVNERHRRWRQ